MRATVVILAKLPGHLPVKTRLIPLLGEQGAIDCYRDMLGRTVALARAFDPEPTLATSPAGVDPAPVLPGIRGVRFRPVVGDDGAACLERALLDAFVPGRPLLALGADAPDLPPALLDRALDLLREHDAVFVPTPDGGFSALGLRAPVRGLAGGFGYGRADARDALGAWLADRGKTVAATAPWPDVDTPGDWHAWRRRADGGQPL